jgi:hypothetical protein
LRRFTEDARVRNRTVLAFIALAVTATAARAVDDGPFGIIDAYASIPNPAVTTAFLTDLRASAVRFGAPAWGGLDWGSSQSGPGAPFDFSEDDPFIGESAAAGFLNLVTLDPIAQWDTESCHTGTTQYDFMKLPCDLDAYQDFVAAAVTHYADQVDHWQVYNEVDGSFWSDTPENYAVLVKATADVIRSLQPGGVILLAGMTDGDFISRVMAKLQELDGTGRPSFDAVDFHHFEFAREFLQTDIDDLDYRAARDHVDEYQSLFAEYGYEGTPIWITETATYSGDPADDGEIPYPPQTEKEQAGDVVKRMIYPLALGVEKVFWVTVLEWYDFNDLGVNGYFDNVGLVRNPRFGQGTYRKLAYYTYKKMTEVLSGADYGSVTTLFDAGNVVIVSFLRGGKPVYAVWWDYFDERSPTGSKTVSFAVPYRRARVTDAVPTASSGKQVGSYSTAFAVSTKTTTNGMLTLTLGRDPLFVEPAS